MKRKHEHGFPCPICEFVEELDRKGEKELANKLRAKPVKITIDKKGNIMAWNTPEFEKLKKKIGAEDDNRKILLGPNNLCG